MSNRPSSRPRAVLPAVFAAMLGAGALGADEPRPSTDWTLVWSDEFSGSGAPSSADWNYHVGNGWNSGSSAFAGWGNWEWQWYRPEQCVQEDGFLVIRADWDASPTPVAGQNWYQRSCRITTAGRRSFTYGRIEARIRMPNAAGSWPAFWMLGDAGDGSAAGYDATPSYYDVMTSNWPSCGEIDIVEHRDSETAIVNNIFWDTRTGVFPWTPGQIGNYAAYPTAGDVSEFHIYAIEWDSTYIRWFVDGVQTHVIDITPSTLEEFHRPFHLILNLAVDGSFPQEEPQPGQFPLTMAVDYVRYYTAGQRAESATSLTAAPNPAYKSEPVVFTATVTPSDATGTVIFRDGATTVGIGPLSAGVATFTTSSLASGTHAMTAAYGGSEDHLGSTSAPLSQTIHSTVAVPSGVTATATSTSQIDVSWLPVSGAAYYEVRRSSHDGPYELAGTVANTTFTDSGRSAGVTYLYVVRAVESSGTPSPDSAADAATTILFTDDPLAAAVTRVKLVHLTELRAAVNEVRAAAGLGAAAFTDPEPSTATRIKRVHIEELRAALDAARASIGMPQLTYTDPAIASASTVVKSAHVQEIRAGVQ